ncbi:MAG: sel1 repeat family protein [Bacteroidales bacterium]|nr:sel1 repeat family protein [Bacteroidales bacterium]
MKKTLFIFIALLSSVLTLRAETPLERMERLVAEGDSAAMYRLSYILETGQGGLPVDSLRADSLLRASAERGYAPACNLLGFRYFETSPDSMLMWIERAATSNPPDPMAMNNLGWLLANGEGGVKRDLKKARYWYERGAAAGVPASMTSLADMLMQAPEAPEDSVRARTLLREAAAKGFRPAGEKLYLLLSQEFETLTPEQALTEGIDYYHDRIFSVSAPLFMQAAKADLPYALALLAQSYAEGLGVDYNYDHAMHLFWHAALLGDPSAAYIVGETLQQFPDAFAEESTSDPEQRTPEEWLRVAGQGGVGDAHDAVARLKP